MNIGKGIALLGLFILCAMMVYRDYPFIALLTAVFGAAAIMEC